MEPKGDAMIINPKVVDLSHYNDVEYADGRYTGFEKLRNAGIVGVIQKATEGSIFVDPLYSRRKKAALAAGLLFGAYHYFTGVSPMDQAEHFLKVAKPDQNTILAVDHEVRGVPLANVAKFCETVIDLIGIRPWIYSGFLIKEQMASADDSYWKQYHLWLAEYTVSPTWPAAWDKPTLWQFTGDGKGPVPHSMPGVRGEIDINSFDGTDEELKAVWTNQRGSYEFQYVS